MPLQRLRVAIVHDWLVVYAGAERVLAAMLEVVPQADIFALVDFLPDAERGFLGGRRPRTSVLQHAPFARRRYRHYLPLMPLAIRGLDLSGYDLVISSAHAVARGVRLHAGQRHISMCYSPMRWAWDLREQYLRETGLDRGLRGVAARHMLDRLRAWDLRAAAGVDEFIAISEFIAARIRRCYDRSATVIYPPVDTDTFRPAGPRGSDYVTASRLVPYKRVDLIVEAFAGMPERRLVVIGDGPEAARVARHQAPNITLLGAQPGPALRETLQRARAFVFAAEEDFGIAPLEAQACGIPVIAYGAGAALETLRGPEHPAPTACFFEAQTVASLQAAVRRFEQEADRYRADACRDNALRFAPARFRDTFAAYLSAAVARPLSTRRAG